MPDTFVSDVGQHIDQAGRVTYDFDAHIHARGLDLDASTSNAPPGDREVRWLRTTDGAVVAEIFAYSAPGFPAGQLELRADRYVGPTRLSSGVAMLADPTGSTVYAYADNNPPATIIDGTGKSSFVRHTLSDVAMLKIGGLYQIDSGPLNPGDISTAVLSHNLGRTVYPLGSILDEGFGVDVSWQYTPLNANQTQFAFRNQGPAPAQGQLNVFLVTLT